MKFLHGKPVMVDHTPDGSDVTAGDVVAVGDEVRVAHHDIADGELGALAAGGGVYEATADDAIAAGKKVYWDSSAGKVTETSTDNTGFGRTINASSADEDPIQVIHDPSAF